MTEKIKILFLALLLASMLMLASFLAGWKIRGEQMRPPVADTLYIERTDTVTLVESHTDTLIRYVDKLYPVSVHDTIVKGDTLFVSLPYEHRHYSKPDTLEVWYSGVDPKIDSATVYMHHTTEIINQPYEVVRMPRMSFGVGVGAFYSEKRVNPYLFGEMRYNAPKTAFSLYGGIDHTGSWGVGAGVSYRIDIAK